MKGQKMKQKITDIINKVKAFMSKYRFDDLRLIYAIPLFLTIIMLASIGFDMYFAPVYITSVLVIAGLFLGSRNAKKILLSLYAVVFLAAVIINAFFVKKTEDYSGDFEKAFDLMREHYVLTEEKGIDWDSLYDKYKPLFEEADRSQDMVQNYKNWLRFTTEFYDGHTAYMMNNQSDYRRAMMESFGNDFGLSLLRLSTGEYVAANVEGYENSYSADKENEDDMDLYRVKDKYLAEDYDVIRTTLMDAGIKNGTVITGWNGKSIDEYFEEMDYYFQAYPTAENEEFYRPVYVAGIGNDMGYGDTFVPGRDGDDEKDVFAMITYLDDNGEKKEIKAPCLGAYMPRLYDTIKKIDAGENITNLTWKSIDEKTMLLRISMMQYDQQSYGEPEMYDDMISKLRSEVTALKENGTRNLIIDLRSNTGGDPFFVQYIAGLFAPKGEHDNLYNAVINEKTAAFERNENGRYTPGEVLTYKGEDLWHDGNIILLVNGECVSAGDDMTYIMGEYPNVKVMGITGTNSSCQAVTQISAGNGALSFSAVPNIDSEGNVVIDTLTDRMGRTPFDEKIPVTGQLVSAVFDKGVDPVLGYVAAGLN